MKSGCFCERNLSFMCKNHCLHVKNWSVHLQLRTLRPRQNIPPIPKMDDGRIWKNPCSFSLSAVRLGGQAKHYLLFYWYVCNRGLKTAQILTCSGLVKIILPEYRFKKNQEKTQVLYRQQNSLLTNTLKTEQCH